MYIFCIELYLPFIHFKQRTLNLKLYIVKECGGREREFNLKIAMGKICRENKYEENMSRGEKSREKMIRTLEW